MIQTIQLYNKGIWRRKMYHAHDEKWKKAKNGMNRTAKSRKNQDAWRKRNLQVLGNIETGHHQTSRDERKMK